MIRHRGGICFVSSAAKWQWQGGFFGIGLHEGRVDRTPVAHILFLFVWGLLFFLFCFFRFLIVQLDSRLMGRAVQTRDEMDGRLETHLEDSSAF